MKTFRLTLLAIVAFLAVPAALHAQGGCADSPEAPTVVLMLVGAVGMSFGSSTARKIARKGRDAYAMNARRSLLTLLGLCAVGLTVGCGGLNSVTSPVKNPVSPSLPKLSPRLEGRVHGGQQPVAYAALHLYVAGTGGYSSTNSDILTSAVSTDATGSFNISGKYTCTAGQKLYLVAIGGNPGGGTNAQAGLMAALGDCATISSSTNVLLNEVTTVASAFALAPFMSGYAALGSSSTNTAGLAAAFNSVNKLANIGTGAAGGPSLATGATAPIMTINTLANILAACVNSTGGVAGDNTTACGKLFTYATPSGGTAPTDTIGLALALAKNPALNVGLLFPYNTPSAPFVPSLTNTPTDFTLAISYTGFSSPQSVTVDASGQVWVANQGNNTVTVLNQSGSVVNTLSGNGLSSPQGIAIDPNGNAWIANSGSATLSTFTGTGTAWTGSPMSTASNAPASLAFDANFGLWVGSNSSNTISLMQAAGTTTQSAWTTKTTYTGVTAPGAIAINPR